MDRKELLNLLDIASAALTPEGAETPLSFQSFCFTNKSILAYNDVIGVRLKNPGVKFEGTAPGRLLLRFIKSCTGSQIEFTDTQKESKWRLQSGPTKLDFSVESTETFPFKFPSVGDGFELEDTFFDALELCASVVNERGLAAWTAGVVYRQSSDTTLGATSGTRDSIHICEISGQGPTASRQVIMPISFCRTLLDMRKAFGEVPATMAMDDHYVVVKFGDWDAIFTKNIIPEEKVELIEKASGLVGKLDSFVPISDKFREVIVRASAMISGEDDYCELQIAEDNKLYLRTRVKGGVLRDAMTLKGEHPPIRVKLHPKRLALKMDRCSEFCVSKHLIGMKSENGSFIKLVANRV